MLSSSSSQRPLPPTPFVLPSAAFSILALLLLSSRRMGRGPNLNIFWKPFGLLFGEQITFLGLCMIFVNFGTMLWYDPGYGTTEMPRWVYYSFVHLSFHGH
jgi:hypothetical protein